MNRYVSMCRTLAVCAISIAFTVTASSFTNSSSAQPSTGLTHPISTGWQTPTNLCKPHNAIRMGRVFGFGYRACPGTTWHLVPHGVMARCQRPAPTSAAGFARLWAALPTRQWGAADGSISVPLADGRSVWLYDDTFRGAGFVHSSAITQDRGCLHVSHGGAQMLPNDDARHIYWIDTARAGSGWWAKTVTVRARSITLTGSCPWCFMDAGSYRDARFTVTSTGDLTFNGWLTGKVVSPAPDPGPLINCEAPAWPKPHHFCYARHTHPQFRLASGRTLVTTCSNYDDGVLHPYADYRPIWSEQ